MRGSGSNGARSRRLPTAARSHCAPPARTRSGAGTSLILASLVAGQFFYLYLILDVFSRQPRGLGGLRRAGEPSRPRSCSARLILARRGGHPGAGPALRQWLAYERRHSAGHPATAGGRPLLQPPRGSSNDHPYSEALFKTCNYHPGFPEQPSEESRAGPHLGRRIRPLVQRRAPPQRHPLRHPRSTATGASEQAILDRRKALYEAAQAAHPERWSRGTRNWDRIDSVSLNPSKSSSEEKPGDSQKAA